MYIEFLTALVILIFSFRVLTVVITWPLAYVEAWWHFRHPAKDPRLTLVLRQTGLCVVLALFVGVICSTLAANRPMPSNWLYGVTGFIATFLVLARNAQARASTPEAPSDDPQLQAIHEGSVMGAHIGFAAGLAAFPIAYFWPATVQIIPGARTFFVASIAVATWLGSFWLVKAAAGLSVLGYIVNGGCLALLAAGMLLYGAGAALKSLLRPTPSQPPNSAPDAALLAGLEAYEEGEVHLRAKRHEEALRSFDTAIEHGVRGKVYELRAMCLQPLDLHLDAIDDYTTAIATATDNANLFFMRSLSRSAIGDVDGAISDLERAVQLSRAPTPANRAADAYSRETGWDSATAFYEMQLAMETVAPLPESLREKRRLQYSTRRPRQDA